MPEHKIGNREEWQAARDELAKLEAGRERYEQPLRPPSPAPGERTSTPTDACKRNCIAGGMT